MRRLSRHSLGGNVCSRLTRASIASATKDTSFVSSANASLFSIASSLLLCYLGFLSPTGQLPFLFASRAGSAGLHRCEDSGNALASTDTHADQRIPPSAATEFVQGLHRQDAACGRDG